MTEDDLLRKLFSEVGVDYDDFIISKQESLKYIVRDYKDDLNECWNRDYLGD